MNISAIKKYLLRKWKDTGGKINCISEINIELRAYK